LVTAAALGFCVFIEEGEERVNRTPPGGISLPAFKNLPQFVRMAAVEVERDGNDLGLGSLLRDPWPAKE